MGLIRKVLSLSTVGAVDFRSDKERTAAYTKDMRREAVRQTKLLREATAAAPQKSARRTVRDAIFADMKEAAAMHKAGDLTDAEFAEFQRDVLARMKNS